MQIDAVKKYIVEVYSDKGPLEVTPGEKLGEFSSRTKAIDVYKQVFERVLELAFPQCCRHIFITQFYVFRTRLDLIEQDAFDV